MTMLKKLGGLITLTISMITEVMTNKYQKNINQLNLLLPIFKESSISERTREISYTLEVVMSSNRFLGLQWVLRMDQLASSYLECRAVF